MSYTVYRGTIIPVCICECVICKGFVIYIHITQVIGQCVGLVIMTKTNALLPIIMSVKNDTLSDITTRIIYINKH